jgi:hypothetical protein
MCGAKRKQTVLLGSKNVAAGYSLFWKESTALSKERTDFSIDKTLT